MKGIMTNGISKNYNGEEIKVIVELENTVTKQKFTAISGKDYDEKKEMVFDKIPYGAYTVTILLYDYHYPHNGELISIIRDDLVVASGTASKVEGVVGAPNKVDFNHMVGSIKKLTGSTCTDTSCTDPNNCFMYEIKLEFLPVSTNYIGETGTDYIDYTIRIGENINNLRTPDDFESIINHAFNRANTNIDKLNFIDTTEYPNGRVPACHIEDIDSNMLRIGNTIFWQVVAKTHGAEEKYKSFSKPMPIVVIEEIIDVNNFPNKVSNDERTPEDKTTMWYPSYGFSWKHVTSVSNNSSFNDITYKLHISRSENFIDDSNETLIFTQNKITDIEDWESNGTVSVNDDTENGYGDMIGMFISEGIFYWKVEAINSAGSSMSDVWEFGIY